MTLAFLQLPASERKVYIEEASARRGLAPVIVEKDFWVCWLLGLLFQSSFRDAIVFKGGTSLSKVINRFSEDIDLSLAPSFLGLDEPDAAAALSKGQAGKWMERAEAKCTEVVRDALASEIASVIETHLGAAEQPWLTFEVDAHRHLFALGGGTTFSEIIDRVRRHASLTGEAFLPPTDSVAEGGGNTRTWLRHNSAVSRSFECRERRGALTLKRQINEN
jgi:hypothetical protein